jgi:predicted RNA-binding protein (virulence factor B family)
MVLVKWLGINKSIEPNAVPMNLRASRGFLRLTDNDPEDIKTVLKMSKNV